MLWNRHDRGRQCAARRGLALKCLRSLAEALVQKIRQWLDTSFQETEEERLRRKGALKARFTVNLSPSMWQELQRLGRGLGP